MENFILYFGKVTVLLTIFFLAYYFLLRKETFFTANRWFLLTGIATSLALPLVIFKKIVLIQPTVTNFVSPIHTNSNTINNVPIPQETAFEINWFYVIGIVYLVGMLFFLGKFIKNLWALKNIFKGQTVENKDNFKFIDTNKIQSPFSFFKYIVFNSSIFKTEELENILEHEKVHSSQMHSADMIFSQLFCIAFWFNPFSWLHKKAIAQNLEFIADSTALKSVSDRIIYQKTLLKVSAPHQCIPITNHFFQSLIKKRIVMLNKNQSNKRNSLKYLAILPLLTVFMLQFQVKTVAQENPQTKSQKNYFDTEIVIDKNSTDADLKQKAEALKKEGVTLKFSKVKRNSKNEIIAIKTSYEDKKGNSSENYQKSDEPITPFKISVSSNSISISSTGSSVYENPRNVSTVTSKTQTSQEEMPVPPTPPVPPVMVAMPDISNIPVPVAPVMPPVPPTPSVAYNENNKDWKKFEEQMKQFEVQMKAKEGEFAKYEKEMEKYGEQLEKAFSPEFEKQMAEFEKKMEIFETEMEAFQEKMQKNN